jgi:hypothetical protein
MIEGEYARVARSAVLARMLTQIGINILTVFFSGVELSNAINVLYSIPVAAVTVTPTPLLAVATVPLRESVRFISKVEFALGLPLLLR